MKSKTLKVAVISDLHCHPQKEESKDNNTYLFSDLLRTPSIDHPVENLLEVIKFKVDLVLSPGDITDQCNKQGLISGWSYVNEISNALYSDGVIATLGNHDIDSRLNYSNYSFDLPKKIKQNFPLSDKYLSNFWGDGFSFIESDTFLILVINSTHFHTHSGGNKPVDNPAVKGKIDTGQLEKIKHILDNNNSSDKIKIALCHHPPVEHSRLNLGGKDHTENGKELLDILGNHHFDLFIYGHKHDPWLRYENTQSGYQLPVLSSGSFSATGQIIHAGRYNYFHAIEIEKTNSEAATGKLKTWTYKPGVGWSIDRADGFLPYTGFGFHGSLNDLMHKIKAHLSQKGKIYMWEDVLKTIPEIENLTPDKMDNLEGLLQQEKIVLPSKIGLRPKHIYYEQP